MQTSPAAREKQRKQKEQASKSALRKSMLMIEAESRRLAKGLKASDQMAKAPKVQFLDKAIQGFIQKNLHGMLGHLGNITGAIVERQDELRSTPGRSVGDVLGRKKPDEHVERERLRAHSVAQQSHGQSNK